MYGVKLMKLNRNILLSVLQMSQELKKLKKKAKNGSGTDNIINTCNWPYFQDLQFLLPVLTHDNAQSSYVGASVSVVSTDCLYT